MRSSQTLKASCSNFSFCSTTCWSAAVARRRVRRSGWTIRSSSTSLRSMATSPYSMPREVSTITAAPFLGVRAPGSK
jgi:hypothetical protein